MFRLQDLPDFENGLIQSTGRRIRLVGIAGTFEPVRKRGVDLFLVIAATAAFEAFWIAKIQEHMPERANITAFNLSDPFAKIPGVIKE